MELVQNSASGYTEEMIINGCVVRQNFAREGNKNTMLDIEKILRNSYRETPENQRLR